MEVGPQTRPPPNGTQAHDMSRELWFGRPAHVGATPLGDGLVCWSKATTGVPTGRGDTSPSAPKKEALESGKNLTQFGHPCKSPCRASLRSDNCPTIPDECPIIFGMGVRIHRNAHNVNAVVLPGFARILCGCGSAGSSSTDFSAAIVDAPKPGHPGRSHYGYPRCFRWRLQNGRRPCASPGKMESWRCI